MHGWEVFPNNKRCRMQKKKNISKLIYSIKTNLTNSFLVRFLSSIRYIDSRAVSGALLVALKVSLLRVITIQSSFQYDS